MLTLIAFTNRVSIMGAMANNRPVAIAATVAAIAILGLNMLLLFEWA
jgi:Mn2+/Fe2+ NRAMP family transporter